MDLQIGKEAHAEGGERGDGGSGCYDVALDSLDTQHVLLVIVASAPIGTNTGTATLGDNRGVDSNDVGHGEEDCEASSDLGKKQRPFALPGLSARGGVSKCQVPWLGSLMSDKGMSAALT